MTNALSLKPQFLPVDSIDQNLVDAYLTKEALEECFEQAHINVVHDGTAAVAFLRWQGGY